MSITSDKDDSSVSLLESVSDGRFAVYPEDVLQPVNPVVGSQVILKLPFVEEAQFAARALADPSGELRLYQHLQSPPSVSVSR